MILLCRLICTTIVLKEFVSADRFNVWKVSRKPRPNLGQCLPHKYLRSIIGDCLPNVMLPFTKVQEKIDFESALAEIRYPLTIVDSLRPFYFITDGYDHIVGPFPKDVRDTYKRVLSQTAQCSEINFEKENKANESQSDPVALKCLHTKNKAIEYLNITQFEDLLESNDNTSLSGTIISSEVNCIENFDMDPITSLQDDIIPYYIISKDDNVTANNFSVIHNTPTATELPVNDQIDSPPLFNDEFGKQTKLLFLKSEKFLDSSNEGEQNLF